MKRFVQSKIGFPCPPCGDKMVATCNHTTMATLEHVIPLSHGGSNHSSNLDVICLSCQRARNYVKQYFENQEDFVPKEYWQLSLCPSLIHFIDAYYIIYHDIFIKARFG